MKSILLVVFALTAVSAVQADEIRNLQASPLSKREWKAYRAAQSLAKELGVKISAKCVNASFEADANPVTLQFLSKDEENGENCVDPHYSIEVEMDGENRPVRLSLTDA